MLFSNVNAEKNQFMKLKIALGLVIVLFAFSCKKDSNSNPLIGKWRSTEIYYPPDGEGMYMTKYGINTANGELYVQFGQGGAIQSTFFSDPTSYSTKGNAITIYFTGAADLTQSNFTYTIKKDTLTLYPTSDCSGCSFPFVKE